MSNTLIARTAARAREIGVRLAIGAGKGRIIGESVMEAFLLAALGGALSIPLTIALSVGLRAFPLPFLVPIAVDLSIDWRTAAFLAALSAMLAVIAGTASAWKAAGQEVSLVLRGSGPSSALARHAFLVAQIAVSFVLLTGAGLLAKSLNGLEQADAGYRAGGVSVARVEMTFADSRPEPARAKQREMLTVAAAIPGVDHAALAWEIFPTLIRNARPVRAADSGIELPVERSGVSPGFFETLGMPLLAGRDFRDTEEHRVAIVNQTAARRFWSSEPAIGKLIRLDGEKEDRLVIGVVRDAKYHDLEEAPAPFLFLPMSQSAVMREPALFVHSRQGTLPVAALRREIARDRALLVTDAETLDDYMASRLSQPRLAAFLASGVAIVGLILSAIGLHSILAYFVTTQLREIGIRVAIGAQAADIVRLVARRSLAIGLAGLGLGTIAALSTMRLAQSQLHSVASSDPGVYFGAGAVFLAIIAVAAMGPASRALRIDPASLLRSN